MLHEIARAVSAGVYVLTRKSKCFLCMLQQMLHYRVPQIGFPRFRDWLAEMFRHSSLLGVWRNIAASQQSISEPGKNPLEGLWGVLYKKLRFET